MVFWELFFFIAALPKNRRTTEKGVCLRPDFPVNAPYSCKKRCIIATHPQLWQAPRIRQRSNRQSIRGPRRRSDYCGIDRKWMHGIDTRDGRKASNILAMLLRVCNHYPACPRSDTGFRLPVFRPKETLRRQRIFVGQESQLAAIRSRLLATGRHPR